MDKHFAIIGTGRAGKTLAMELALQNNEHLIHQAEDDKFLGLMEPETFLITKLPDLTRPYLDTTKTYFNFKKHKQTCDKKRKARKRKCRK